MKKIISFVVFIFFLILLWFSWNWYKNKVACCPENKEAAIVGYGPLIFNCANEDAITNDLWPDKKNEILAGKVVGKKLLL